MATISCQVAIQHLLDQIDHLLACQLWGEVPEFCDAVIRFRPDLDNADQAWLMKEMINRVASCSKEQVQTACHRVIEVLGQGNGQAETGNVDEDHQCEHDPCRGCESCSHVGEGG